jgi:ABC-2 type transport system permease protein
MFKNFSVIIEFEFRALWSDKPTLIRSLIEPLAYLFFLAAGLSSIIDNESGNYISFVFPGVLTLQLFRMFTYSIYRLTVDRRWGLQALKIISGTPIHSYIFGTLFIPTLLFVLQAVIIYPFALFLGAKFSMLGFAFLVFVGATATVFWVLLAIYCTFYFKKYSQRDLFISFLFLPLSLSAPVFYSLDKAPSYLQIISKLNPLTYQVIAMRQAYLDQMFAIPFTILICSIIMMFLLICTIMKDVELLPSEL